MKSNSTIHQAVTRFLIVSAIVTFVPSLFAQERDVSKWIEVARPKDSTSPKGILWNYRANHSTNAWRVFFDGKTVGALLTTQTNLVAEEAPNFAPETEKFHRTSAVLKVPDGWLVGFNRGEWGGALYWFSSDGTTNYQISKRQIVDIIRTSNGIFAIEGLDHMGLSEGNLISVSQSSNQAPWQVVSEHRLPQAPYTVVEDPNGTLLIVLSDSFISATPDGRIKTIVKEAYWGGLYPNSMVLSKDAKTVYVGMRQYVAKITLKNGNVSLLIPAM